MDLAAPSTVTSASEREQRIHLAAAYRLAEHFGWTQLVWNHISARVPGRHNAFLINQLGLMYDEVTASNLVMVDVDGALLEGDGRTSEAGFVIHSAVHRARPDVLCVMHSHTPEAVAASCLDEELPQLCGETAYFYNDLAYYDYDGVSTENDERENIARALGAKNNLVLRNHGLLTTGRTVGEAFVRMYWLIYCCRIVTALHATGRPFTPLSPALAAKTAEQDIAVAAPSDFEWSALLRRLDRIAPGYSS